MTGNVGPNDVQRHRKIDTELTGRNLQRAGSRSTFTRLADFRRRTSDTNGSALTELILTFVPVYAVLVTIVAALATGGRWRWLMLAVVPAVGTVLSWAALPLTGDGNMLSVTLVLLLVTGLMAYYPILVIAALVAWYRTRRSLA